MSAPESIGPYRILREIGRSNAVVYEAIDTRTDLTRALKVITGTDATSRAQFEREAKILTSVSHPNIIATFGAGEEGGRPYVAMEFLDGHTLFEEIQTSGPLSEARAIQVLVPVLGALSYIHERRMVHRDVKPDHIFLVKDGTVRLTDFGVAKLPFGPDILLPGGYIGTPEYMSPEQSEGREVDQRTDLFSLGVSLYEALSGKNPFRGETIHAVLYAVKYKNPPKIDGVSEGCWGLFQKALAKSLLSRFESATAFLQALEAVEP